MHATHEKILNQLKILMPKIKISEYISMLNAAISNVDYVDIYPLTKELITVTDISMPTALTFEFVLIKRIYATSATTLAGVPTAVNTLVSQYEVEQNAVWIKATGNYVIEYYYRPDITDENSDPKIPDAYIPCIVEHISYQAMLQIDVNKAMVYLQNSNAHALKAHMKETRKQKNAQIKPLL